MSTVVQPYRKNSKALCDWRNAGCCDQDVFERKPAPALDAGWVPVREENASNQESSAPRVAR
jgi:hypothetical protein